MIKRNARIPGAVLLVLGMLLLASLACYSDQIPGVLELTPVPTVEVLPTPEDSAFGTDQYALVPFETDSKGKQRANFNLTLDPEPLADSLVNSKESCLTNAVADILHAAVAKDDNIYYLVECNGSVGWTVESRLLGPLQLRKGSLALTSSGQAVQGVTLKSVAKQLVNFAIGLAQDEKQAAIVPMVEDLDTFKPIFYQVEIPGAQENCKDGTIVTVLAIEAADGDGDGRDEIYYQVECPARVSKGWVTEDALVGPLEVNRDDLALALADEGETEYLLADKPTRVNENNVGGVCEPNAILTIQEARLVRGQVYYSVTCGDGQQGWTDASRFAGPLRFPVINQNLVVFTPSSPTFVDELPPDVAAALLGTLQEDGAAEGEGDATGDAADAADAGDVADAGDTASDAAADGGGGTGRTVVDYAPPVYLTDKPEGPVLPEFATEDEPANVVSKCNPGTVVYTEDFAGTDTIYYLGTCQPEGCTSIEEGTEPVCTGWVDQQYLQGPVEFVPGQVTAVKDSSRAMLATEEGVSWARIPAQRTGAFTLGENTTFSGRCLLEDGVEVVEIFLDKDRTRDAFTIYYRIQCTGEPASYVTTTDSAGRTTAAVVYAEGESELLTGWFLGKDLVPVEE